MKQTHPLLGAALALALYSAAAAAIDFPTLKSGLWESRVNRDAAQKSSMPVTRICIDSAVQKEMLDMGMGSMKSMCSKNDLRRDGNRIYGEAECKLGESTMKSKSVTTFTSDSAYHTEVKSSYEPPFMGRSASTTVIDAKWTGACPAGVRPGDVIMPDGKSINMRDMTRAPRQTQ